MGFVDCNIPGTNGYSAAISGFHILKMYAHGLDTTTHFDLDMDDDASSVLWMYMPIDADEYLVEVWAVKHPRSGFLGFMVRCGIVEGRALALTLSVLAFFKPGKSSHVRELQRTSWPPTSVPPHLQNNEESVADIHQRMGPALR